MLIGNWDITFLESLKAHTLIPIDVILIVGLSKKEPLRVLHTLQKNKLPTPSELLVNYYYYY